MGTSWCLKLDEGKSIAAGGSPPHRNKSPKGLGSSPALPKAAPPSAGPAPGPGSSQLGREQCPGLSSSPHLWLLSPQSQIQLGFSLHVHWCRFGALPLSSGLPLGVAPAGMHSLSCTDDFKGYLEWSFQTPGQITQLFTTCFLCNKSQRH